MNAPSRATVTITQAGIDKTYATGVVLSALDDKTIIDCARQRGIALTNGLGPVPSSDRDDDIRATLLRGDIPEALIMLERRLPGIDRNLAHTVTRYFEGRR